MPSSMAVTTAAVRSSTPSLANTRCRCVLTVASPMNSSRPTSALLSPRPMQARTSISRAVRVGGQHRLAPRSAADGVDEVVHGRVLEHVPGGPCLDGVEDVDVGVVGGHDQDVDTWLAAADLGGGADPVGPGHPQVHEDHVGHQLVDEAHGVGPGGGLAHDVHALGHGQHGAQALADHRMVIDHHDAHGAHVGAGHANTSSSGGLFTRPPRPTSPSLAGSQPTVDRRAARSLPSSPRGHSPAPRSLGRSHTRRRAR